MSSRQPLSATLHHLALWYTYTATLVIAFSSLESTQATSVFNAALRAVKLSEQSTPALQMTH